MTSMTKHTLIDCFTLRARIGWQGLRSDEFKTEGPYLVTGVDFRNGRINWDDCYHVTEERYAQDKGIQLHEHDLLITKDGTIGKTAVVIDCPEKATLNSGIFVVRAIKNDVVPEFLHYVLHSHWFDLFVRNMLTGSTIKHLNQDKFYKFSFEAPDVPTQRKIVEVLESIDDVIDKTRDSISKYQNIRIGLLRDLFIPKDDSEIRRFDSIAKNITRKRVPEVVDVCINMDCIEGGTGNLISVSNDDMKSEKIMFDEEDILFGKLRPYLRKYHFAKFAGLCSSEIMVLRPICIKSKFLYYIVSSDAFINYNNSQTFGTRMPRTSWNIISKYKAYAPSAEKQEEIITIMDSLEKKINDEQIYLDKLTMLHHGMVNDLLSGNVDVGKLI